MLDDWRPPVAWLLAITVGGILLVGVWLHPQPALLVQAAVSRASTMLSRPVVAYVSQPSRTRPTSTPAALVVVSPTAVPDKATDGRAHDSPEPARSPLPVSTAATLKPASADLAIVSTPTPPAVVTSRGTQTDGVPILMYHYVRINPVASDRAGFVLSVTPADLALQMRFLVDSGFHTVTMAQVREYILHGTPLPPKPIAITFDDGYDDAYTAARPVLEQYHLTATFFVITGFLDHPHYMTWAEVEALDREGMEIGSHTVHHRSLPHLDRLELHLEVTSSRSDLETHLGHPVLDFSYPSGELNQAVVQAAEAAGYLSATTTRPGVAQRGANPLELPRLRVWGGMTLRQFADVVGEPLPNVSSVRGIATMR